MENQIKLYIVSKDDTLENIANKMNCSVNEIKSLNRMTKNRLILNQPILVPFKEKILERESSSIITKEEMITLLFFIKETFLTCIFCFDAYDLLFNKTYNYLKKINFDNQKNEYLKKLLLFPSILIRKDEKQLLEYEKDLKSDLEKLTDNDNSPLNTTNLKYISEQFQLHVLKVASKNYKEAEFIFTNIMHTINLF